MTKEEKIKGALARDGVVDITTIGRKTKKPRRIEIWYHSVDGHVYLSGLPGPRSWYANLLANPDFTFHLKEEVRADLAAKGTPILDRAERKKIISKILSRGRSSGDLEAWMSNSPLVEVTFPSLVS